MVIRVVQPSSDRPLLSENGAPATQLNSWLKVVTDGALIIGTGSPETVVEAPQGASYMNDAGTTGTLLYLKRDADIGGDKTQGWLLV